MQPLLVTPEIQLSEEAFAIAAEINLADLLECPNTASDAISLVSNLARYVSKYTTPMEGEDQRLEVLLLRLSNAIDTESRTAAFAHIKERLAARRVKDCD